MLKRLLLVSTFSTSSFQSKLIPYQLLYKRLFYLSSILKNPTDQKFRVFKKSNKAIQSKLLALQPSGAMIELIEALGYTFLDDEMHAFAGDYFEVLMAGSKMIDDASTKLKMENMSAEEKAKMEMIKKNQEDYKKKMQADAEYKKHLEELSQKERKVK